ncbi:pyridoxamine 5'-phosphate oxidase family protein [Streptomyces sp. NPDC004111]|uniref:pyridoxamine 5'-phosphate oxidase family protein n=1 Tax=Streptomyces sp. NPDC004111 TaxID=3364690 RepID=UPI0036CBCA07
MESSRFDVDAFLRQPLTARIATGGPTVRPVWYLWEEGAFWILTGRWARLCDRVKDDPNVALVVDECDLATGLVRQVVARGRAELVPFDVPRGRRKLARYLGPDANLQQDVRARAARCHEGLQGCGLREGLHSSALGRGVALSPRCKSAGRLAATLSQIDMYASLE